MDGNLPRRSSSRRWLVGTGNRVPGPGGWRTFRNRYGRNAAACRPCIAYLTDWLEDGSIVFSSSYVRQYRGRRSNVPPRNGNVPPIFSSRIARCTERSAQAWKRFWTNPTRVLFICRKQMLFGQLLRVSIMWIRRQPSVCR